MTSLAPFTLRVFGLRALAALALSRKTRGAWDAAPPVGAGEGSRRAGRASRVLSAAARCRLQHGACATSAASLTQAGGVAEEEALRTWQADRVTHRRAVLDQRLTRIARGARATAGAPSRREGTRGTQLTRSVCESRAGAGLLMTRRAQAAREAESVVSRSALPAFKEP